MRHKDLTFYFKCIAKHLEQKAIAYVNDNGLTLKQGRAIDFLSSRPGKSASQKEMGTFFQVSHPTITGIVHRMEKQGLVSVDSSRKGRTSKKVTLTEKGLEICRQNEKIAAGYRKTMLKGFTEEETAEFESMLHRVCLNICPKEINWETEICTDDIEESSEEEEEEA